MSCFTPMPYAWDILPWLLHVDNSNENCNVSVDDESDDYYDGDDDE